MRMNEIEQHLILKFYKERNKNVQKAYVNYLLANLCMPTLMKLKPSSIIHIDKKSLSDRRGFLKAISQEIRCFDCRAFILYEDESMIILMIYQAELMLKILSLKENQRFLSVYGYQKEEVFLEKVPEEISSVEIASVDKVIVEKVSLDKNSIGRASVKKISVDKALLVLRRRYANYKKHLTDGDEQSRGKLEYPHEIGLFLGYPVRDVQDFIKYEGKNYLVCGYWKVYHDVDKALATFDYYQRIRNYAIRGILSGKQLKDIRLSKRM